MIHQMVKESLKVMFHSKCESDLYIIHSALSLMTAHATKEWMRNQYIDGKTYFERWFFPQNKLNIGTSYFERLVGILPEPMPLDNSLNIDIKSSHLHHCILTAHLNNNDKRKFSMRAPRIIERGILRIWDNPEGPPSGIRIKHDISKSIDTR